MANKTLRFTVILTCLFLVSFAGCTKRDRRHIEKAGLAVGVVTFKIIELAFDDNDD